MPVDWDALPRSRSGAAGSACRPIRSSARATGSARRCAPPTARPPSHATCRTGSTCPEWQPRRRRARTAPAARGRARARHRRRGRARRRGRRPPPARGRPSRIVVRHGVARSNATPSDEFVVDPDDPDSLRADGGRGLRHRTPGRRHRLLGAARARLDRPRHRRARAVPRRARSSATRSAPEPTVRPLPIVLVARGTDRVLDDDVVDPARAFSVGAAQVLPQEHPGFRLTHVDVDDHPTVPDLLVAELTDDRTRTRRSRCAHGERFVRVYRPSPIRRHRRRTGSPSGRS